MENWLNELITNYGLAGIFIAMAIENLGVPFVIGGAFVLAYQLVVRDLYSFWFMYWLIVVAQIVGAIAAYAIGRWIGIRILRYLPQSHGLRAAGHTLQNWYSRYGSATVFIANLVGYVRPWASLVAGWSQYGFSWFVIWTVLGTALFVYLAMSAMSFLVWAWVESPVAQVAMSVMALLAVAVLIYFGARSHQSRHKRRRA